MARKAKTVIMIGVADLAIEKGSVYVQGVTFSGPRTAKLFGNRLTVRIVVSQDAIIPQLWLATGNEPAYGDEQCCVMRADCARYELSRFGISLSADLDGNPVEFDLTDEATAAIRSWHYRVDELEDAEDLSEVIPDAPPVEEEPSEEVAEEPEAVEAAAEEDETDAGEEEDYGYTDEAEEDSSEDDGELELPDFSTMSRKELVKYAATFELEFNSRTSEDKLREMVEEAYLAVMAGEVEA